MKKIVSLFLALVLIVAMAVPAMALSSTTKHVLKEGSFSHANGKTYSVLTDTAASTSKASATMSCGMSARLSITLNAELYEKGTDLYLDTKTENGFISDTALSVSIDAPSATKLIQRAAANYLINGALTTSAVVE